MSQFDTSSFDQAAEEAEKDFTQLMKEMTPEEKAGVLKVQTWIKKWFMSAGLKRLMRIVRDMR
jgi:hypothetical protein